MGLEIERAAGAWLYAKNGKRYLDFIAGIGVSALGHGHPEIVAAIEHQLHRHLHVMVYGEYVIEAQVRLAERLAGLLPARLSRVYLTTSGAEAIEGALKLARKFTGRHGFAAFDGAYHGDTTGALALAGNSTFRTPFEPLIGPVRRLPYGDKSALQSLDDSLAAVIIEPVQAEGGVRVPAVDFMRELRSRCDHTGALLVFDEVLSGLGRTGRLFALEHFGVIPDVVVLAKALGGGLPLGAFVARDELLATLAHDPPLGHITTFGGHPLSCAAGLATLDTIVHESLAARAAELGADLLERLRVAHAPEVSEVRGIGLLVGIEFRNASLARRFVAESLAREVVVNWTLNADRVVRLAPPLNVTASEVDFALGVFDSAFEQLRT